MSENEYVDGFFGVKRSIRHFKSCSAWKHLFFAANISRFWLERCFMFYKQSSRMCWVDPITPFSVTDWHFSLNDEARPQGPPPRLKGSAQRVLKLQFDPSMHTLSSILLHISAGIVSIHKCCDWREPTMPSVVVVNFWLRGPGLHGSGPRWGVGSEVEYLTFLRDDSLVTTPDAGARIFHRPDLLWQRRIRFGWRILSGAVCFLQTPPRVLKLKLEMNRLTQDGRESKVFPFKFLQVVHEQNPSCSWCSD